MNQYIQNFKDESAPLAVGYVIGDAAGTVASGMLPGNVPGVVSDLIVFVGGNVLAENVSGMVTDMANGMAVAGAKGSLDFVVAQVSDYGSTNALVNSIFGV